MQGKKKGNWQPRKPAILQFIFHIKPGSWAWKNDGTLEIEVYPVVTKIYKSPQKACNAHYDWSKLRAALETPFTNTVTSAEQSIEVDSFNVLEHDKSPQTVQINHKTAEDLLHMLCKLELLADTQQRFTLTASCMRRLEAICVDNENNISTPIHRIVTLEKCLSYLSLFNQ